MWARLTLLRIFVMCSVTVCVAGRAVAELLTALFPDGVPGYDADDGVTVQTRLHPEQMPLGIREDAFLFSPRLDEGLGYTSNALPGPYRRGSWEVITSPSLGVLSGWSRDSLGAYASLQNTRYFALPSQDRTDAALSIGGQIDIGEDKLTLGAAHLSQHEDRGALDTIASDRPIGFTVDDVRAAYTFNDARWTIEPALDIANWAYSPTTILGVPASQAYRDRVISQARVTVRYELAALRELLFVARVIGQDYTHIPPGQPTSNAVSYQLLAGLNYDDNTVWHWRLLFGGEDRQFASPLYHPETTLIAEAGAIWSPSGLTTVGATLSRETGDAAQEGVSGLVYSTAQLTIDHEYLRDLLLHAAVGLQRADFFQGGHQQGTTAGLAVTWVLNRSARLAFTYDQSDLRGSSIPTEALGTGYSRGVGLITMRLGL